MNDVDSAISVSTRRHIKKALLIALITILVQLVFLITMLIFTIIDLNKINEMDYRSLINIYFAETIIRYLLIGTFFAMMIIWLVKYYKASKELSDRSRKIIVWSIGVFSVYVFIYFVYWFAISPNIFYMAAYEKMGYGWYEGINSFIWLVSTIALMMVFILPLQPITSKKVALIALIGGAILILGMNGLTDRLWEDLGEKMAGSEFYKSYHLAQIFFRFPIMIISYILIGISYLMAFRNISTFDIRVSSWEARVEEGRLSKGFFRKYLTFTGKNPYRNLIIFGVVSLILGTIMGTTADNPFARSYDSSDYEWEYYPEEGIHTTAFDGYLNEGEEVTESIDVYVEVSYIEIQLIWTDESDLRGRENQGDQFEVEIDADGLIETGAGMNSHRENGIIMIYYDHIGYTTDLDIIIRMINAGDQQLIFGPGVLSWTDNGNEYSMIIEIGYMG